MYYDIYFQCLTQIVVELENRENMIKYHITKL